MNEMEINRIFEFASQVMKTDKYIGNKISLSADALWKYNEALDSLTKEQLAGIKGVKRCVVDIIYRIVRGESYPSIMKSVVENSQAETVDSIYWKSLTSNARTRNPDIKNFFETWNGSFDNAVRLLEDKYDM